MPPRERLLKALRQRGRVMTPRKQLLKALDEVREALDLHAYLANEAMEAVDSDTDLGKEIKEAGYEPRHVFFKSVRLLDVLRCFAEKATVQEIHRTFGAPGDWGYHTPLGDALYRLYSEKETA